MDDITVVMVGNGRLFTDSKEKVNSLNFFYSSVFSCELSVQQIQCANWCEPFDINTTSKTIRRRLTAIGKKKSVGTHSISVRF